LRESPLSTYSHTQRSPLGVILLLVGLAVVGAGWLFTVSPTMRVILTIGAAALVLGAFCFATLTVEDGGDVLRLRYGPIPLFRFRFRYQDISSVDTARSDLIDGLGIHYVPTRGWIYNLWGFRCVRVTHRGRHVRIGTDDVEGLVALLRQKIQPAAT
jgi:hypothetical protein